MSAHHETNTDYSHKTHQPITDIQYEQYKH